MQSRVFETTRSTPNDEVSSIKLNFFALIRTDHLMIKNKPFVLYIRPINPLLAIFEVVFCVKKLAKTNWSLEIK